MGEGSCAMQLPSFRIDYPEIVILYPEIAIPTPRCGNFAAEDLQIFPPEHPPEFSRESNDCIGR